MPTGEETALLSCIIRHQSIHCSALFGRGPAKSRRHLQRLERERAETEKKKCDVYILYILVDYLFINTKTKIMEEEHVVETEDEVIIIEERQRTCGYYRRKTWQLLSTRASKYRHFTTNKYSRMIELVVFAVLVVNVGYALQFLAEPVDDTEIEQNWIHLIIQTPTEKRTHTNL